MPLLFDTLESRQLFAAVPPTSFEQYLLELTNRARINPVQEATRQGIDLNEGLAAGTITTTAKPPLALNAFLTDSAQQHAAFIRTNGQISYVGAGGTLPIDRINASGYTFTGSTTAFAENITAIFGPTVLLNQATVDQLFRNLFVDAAFADRVNRVNLLNATYREVGNGINAGASPGVPAQQGAAAVQDFALSTSNSNGNVFLTGVAYNDADANNFYTPNAANGEGLGGVTVSARRISDGATFSTSTFASGGYSLRLTPGIYDVTATGGAFDQPGPGGTVISGAVIYRSVVVGSQNVKRDFTFQQLQPAPVPPGAQPPTSPNPVTLRGDIKGKVRLDKSGKGERDDLRYSDVVVGSVAYLDIDNSGTRGGSEPFGLVLPRTNGVGRGIYNITGINPGIYTLRLEPPAGYRVSIPRSTTMLVKITSGRLTKPATFGITENTIISGRVYQDNNINGQYDAATDSGIGGWRTFIDLNNDGIWQRETEPSTLSQPDGYYAFRNLLVGTYTIRAIARAGFAQTEPANNGSYVVQVGGPAFNVINRDFGQRKLV